MEFCSRSPSHLELPLDIFTNLWNIQFADTVIPLGLLSKFEQDENAKKKIETFGEYTEYVSKNEKNVVIRYIVEFE